MLKYFDEKTTLFDESTLTLARRTDELKIGDKSYNESCDDNSKMKMNLSEFKRSKRVEIGNENNQSVREFVADGLESVGSVKIGEHCFRINNKECNDGVCQQTNCRKLRQLQIGDDNFQYFKSLRLSDLNSIQSINFGNGCCFWNTNFSLKGE